MKTKADLPPLFFLSMWNMVITVSSTKLVVKAYPLFFEKDLPPSQGAGTVWAKDHVRPVRVSTPLAAVIYSEVSPRPQWAKVLHVTAMLVQIRCNSSLPLESQFRENLNLRLLTGYLSKSHGGNLSTWQQKEANVLTWTETNRDKKPRETSSIT